VLSHNPLLLYILWFVFQRLLQKACQSYRHASPLPFQSMKDHKNKYGGLDCEMKKTKQKNKMIWNLERIVRSPYINQIKKYDELQSLNKAACNYQQ
jgi:hypothetical protein